ncbi:uncharacterized protein BT62DRAFT_36065 [Guyanagaster necrorhizus]|uniref:Protein kinase domain-containing protein n=1 Tax=Guyanagaster necrorhizus TaxID=856835 RepID=A0A9P8B0C4_9AGAR|nr:uncharacterized protein BT62DRAFT_36065 [Guyanagaster necrorhizus MCA 3950]KAG7452932.1 hypothetical protein BT62DRAFT_36065 [Guyanagaster necrorhizus MCA 3950]
MDILQQIHCLLKGLVWLHERRIVHRDSKRFNKFMNFACGDRWNHSSSGRRSPEILLSWGHVNIMVTLTIA